jgi:hypothetical protein
VVGVDAQRHAGPGLLSYRPEAFAKAVTLENEDESPFVGLLQVEAA